MVEITIVELEDNIPFQEKFLMEVSKNRKEKIYRYEKTLDKKRSLLAELLIQKVTMEKIGLRNAVIYRNRYGKPYIKDEEGFYFNISHSGDYVAIGVSDEEIGIDIERKYGVDYRIAKRFFTPKEAQTILSCIEEQERIDTFFKFWTLKESYVKAIGMGLRIPLSSFEFDIGDEIKVNDSEHRVFFIFIIGLYRIIVWQFAMPRRMLNVVFVLLKKGNCMMNCGRGNCTLYYQVGERGM